jgi:hypothetical protein
VADEPEVQPATTEQEAPATEQAEVVPEQQAAPEPEPDLEVLSKWLDKAPADLLRKHSRFQGILGSEQHRLRTSWEQDRKAQEEADAAARAEEELLNLAREDPITFAEKYLTKSEAERVQSQIGKVRADTASSLMHQIGSSFSKEFSLTSEDVSSIATELQGKSEDEILPAFNIAATRLVAAREAQRIFEDWKTKELDGERKAIKDEVAADLMKKEPAPSVRRSTLPSTVKPHQLSPQDFDKWYEENVLNRAYSTR